MTPYSIVYKAALGRILEDDWTEWSEDEIKEDLSDLLDAALPWFKFPRVSLIRTEEGLEGDLSNEEIQILASLMKCEWLNRNIMTWENVKPLYDERDFSPGNTLDKLNKTLKYERDTARKLESIYYRSIKGSPYDYRKWAGDNT